MADAEAALVFLGVMSLVTTSTAFATDLQALFQLGGRGALVRRRDRTGDAPLRVIAYQDLVNLPTRHGSAEYSRAFAESLESLERREEEDATREATGESAADFVADLLVPVAGGSSAMAGAVAPTRRDGLVLASSPRRKKNFLERPGGGDDEEQGSEEEYDNDEEGDEAEVAVLGDRHAHATQQTAPFWHRPCGRSVDMVLKRPRAGRHGAAKGPSARALARRLDRALDRVWRQLNMTALHYRLQRFDRLYYRVKIGVNEDHYIPSWVPDKDDLPKLTAEDVSSSHRLAHELTQMHTQLQKFSVALEQITEDNQMEDPLRLNALSKTKTHVKMLLCEVEWALLSLAIPLPLAVPRDIMAPGERNLTDDTGRGIRDWGVLIKYRDFLHGWADIVARAGRAASEGRGKHEQQRRRRR